jgi:hypothetical protein
VDFGHSWKRQHAASLINCFLAGDTPLDEDDRYQWVQVDENFDYAVIGIDEQDLQQHVSESSSTKKKEKQKRSSPRKNGRKNAKMKHEEMKHEIDEHPMRTDEWMVDITLSPFLFPPSLKKEAQLFPESSHSLNTSLCLDGLAKSWKGQRRKRQFFKFATNGCVLLFENDDSRMTRIGRWHIDTHGISWVVPIQTSNNRRTTLHYHADIHLNKFQKRPRMFRGQVTRDRFADIQITDKIRFPNYMFRPVVATFTAEGVGKDTVDTSYKNRGFGV